MPRPTPFAQSEVSEPAVGAAAPGRAEPVDIEQMRDEDLVERGGEPARIVSLLALGNELADTNASAALGHARTAATLAQRIGDRILHADALHLCGTLSHRLALFDSALTDLRDALDLFEALRHDRGCAKTLRAIGQVLDDLGDYAQALEHQLRALALDERNGDDASRALTLRTIGIVHSKSGDPQRGLEFYQQSLALTRACGHDAASARTLNNIGINHKNLGNHVEALAALEEALALFRQTESGAGEAAALNNMGLTLERLDRLDDAEECQRASIEIARQVGYTIAEARALKALGDLLIQRERMDEARTALDHALAVAERINARPELALVHRALSDLHKRMNQPAEALAHFERYHQLEREVFNENSDRKLKSLQIAYQTEQAKREAEIHRLRHVELARANDDLQKLNDTLMNADATKTQLLAKLERLSQEDSLTGLANRRHFDAHLAEMFARARRDATPLAVALADIDFFKQINDRCGHATGDEVLRVIARIMREHGRGNDLAARYGGEEFAFVFPCTDAQGAAVVCEKIRAAVEGYAWTNLHPHLHVTISIGICDRTAVPSHEKMLALADDQLYQAKYGGKNQVRIG